MGAAQAQAQAKSIQGMAVVLNWMTFSGGLVLFNKYLLSGFFPYPLALTLGHMTFSFLVALGMHAMGKIEPVHMSRQEYMGTVMPIGVLYALSLWCANSAYLRLSVAFIQMLKAFMPVAVFITGVAFGTDIFRRKTFLNMCVVTLGVFLASFGELNFNFMGIMFQVGFVVAESLRLILIQLLLKGKGKGLDPFQSLLYISPACAACLLVPYLLTEAQDVGLILTFGRATVLLFNCCVALGLNIAVYLLIGSFSALELNFYGIIKDFATIGVSCVMFSTPITFVSIIGYIVSVSAIYYHTWSKAKEKATAEKEQLLPSSNKAEGAVSPVKATA